MATSTNRQQRSHDRRALIQWLLLAAVAIVGLIAAFTLFDGSDNSPHSGAPAVEIGL